MNEPLRVHIITEEDPFYIPVFFHTFLEELPKDRFLITGIDITPPLNQKTPLGLAYKLYRFFGAWDFLRLLRRYVVVKLKDALLPSGRWLGSVGRLTRAYGIPSEVVGNVNDPGYVERVKALKPDLLISVAASQIFKDQLLSVPQRDAINIHTGSLPAYRGMLPVFWQMHDGRREIGISIHTMTARVDIGQLVSEHQVPLGESRCLDEVISRMKYEGALVMLAALERYHAGEVRYVPMDEAKGGYRSFPVREDARRFRSMGYRLL